MDAKFLTVMAVLDEESQGILAAWQGRVLSAGLTGTQTMGIPFHISLGSYPTDREKELTETIRATAKKNASFPLSLTALDDFGSRVLFVKPDLPPALAALRRVFCHDYPHGYPWSPHVTLFCGEEAHVHAARAIMDPLFHPLKSRIVALEMGAFFPPRFICRQDFISPRSTAS